MSLVKFLLSHFHHRAFRVLEKAVDDRYFLMIWINSDPLFDNLRADPRFANLAKQIGLPQ